MDVDDEDAAELVMRGVALHAAAASWSGISAVKDRDASVLETADKYLAWLMIGVR
jgi:hypothetical protein